MMRFDSNIRHRTSIRRSQQKYLKLFTTLTPKQITQIPKSYFDFANSTDLELVGLLNFDPPDFPNSSDPVDLSNLSDLSILLILLILLIHLIH